MSTFYGFVLDLDHFNHIGVVSPAELTGKLLLQIA